MIGGVVDAGRHTILALHCFLHFIGVSQWWRGYTRFTLDPLYRAVVLRLDLALKPRYFGVNNPSILTSSKLRDQRYWRSIQY